jgi:hypothetical protein
MRANNEINQTNEIDETNQNNQINQKDRTNQMRKKTMAGTVSLREAETYVALLTLRLFVFTAVHFPVGRTYSFSSSHVFFNSAACKASSWVSGGVQ